MEKTRQNETEKDKGETKIWRNTSADLKIFKAEMRDSLPGRPRGCRYRRRRLTWRRPGYRWIGDGVWG